MQATSGLLDAWGLGGSTEPLAPHASLPTPTSSRTEQLPFAPQSHQQQQPGGQHWSTNGWTNPPDTLSGGAAFGEGAFNASGLVRESPLSPTEVPSSQALPFSSISSSYPSTYAPYPPPVGSAPPFNPPHPSFAFPNQHIPHAAYQVQNTHHPDYARRDSYQPEPPVQPAPTAQDLYPAFTPSHAYGLQPPPPQQSFSYLPTPPARGGVDQYGRPLLAPAPQWSQVPQLPPQSFYAQHPHFQQQQYLPQQQQSLYTTSYAPSEPTYEAYESTPVSFKLGVCFLRRC